jgi:hypothetical protein
MFPAPTLHSRFRFGALATALSCALVVGTLDAGAQVSAYTFSQTEGTWVPISGSGTPLGLAGLPAPWTIDDASFVVQGQDIPLGPIPTGNGWPIGFTFYYNGFPFDRVGFSSEGWLALGNSLTGPQAVYVPVGSPAYTPLSAAPNALVNPVLNHRIVGFANDLMAGGGVSSWPIQIRNYGTAPDRTFVAEWNLTRTGTAGGSFSFQIRLAEGGGDPAAQTVQIVYRNITASGNYAGQVGLGGLNNADFNNRSITASPFNWLTSVAGTLNNASCRVPATAAELPQGLTFTWTPPACAVNGISISDLLQSGASVGGTLSWLATTGATSYDYVVTAGSPTDTPVASGTGINGTSVLLAGLPTGQQLFAYVRANCTPAGPGWGAPRAFNTGSVRQIICGAAPIQQTHCYANFENRTWKYHSSTGDPVRITILAGTMSSGDLLTCYDGPNDQSPILFTSVGGTLAGQVISSTGGSITMKITADYLGSCATQNSEPLEWEVGCLDCDPVLANFQVVNNCAGGSFNVAVQIFTLGTATSAIITNNGTAAPVTANAAGNYTVGPFPIGTPVLVTVENPLNGYCNAVSSPLLNEPCPIVSCGPDEYEYCYTDDDDSQVVYQALGTERIGIRFLAGSLAIGDILRIYDGPDIFSSAVLHTANGVDITGLVVLSSATSNTILLELAANASASCATEQAEPWEYVIACVQDCAAPTATFALVEDCPNQQFSVSVVITGLGNNGDISITNDAGLPAVSGTTVGTYTVGPFSNGTQVRIALEGDNVLCGLVSALFASSCPVGIAELQHDPVSIYPNPGSGIFRVKYPIGFGGGFELEVHDATGRRVTRAVHSGQIGRELELDLVHLPMGWYVLTMRNETAIAQGRFMIAY